MGWGADIFVFLLNSFPEEEGWGYHKFIFHDGGKGVDFFKPKMLKIHSFFTCSSLILYTSLNIFRRC